MSTVKMDGASTVNVFRTTVQTVQSVRAKQTAAGLNAAETVSGARVRRPNQTTSAAMSAITTAMVRPTKAAETARTEPSVTARQHVGPAQSDARGGRGADARRPGHALKFVETCKMTTATWSTMKDATTAQTASSESVRQPAETAWRPASIPTGPTALLEHQNLKSVTVSITIAMNEPMKKPFGIAPMPAAQALKVVPMVRGPAAQPPKTVRVKQMHPQMSNAAVPVESGRGHAARDNGAIGLPAMKVPPTASLANFKTVSVATVAPADVCARPSVNGVIGQPVITKASASQEHEKKQRTNVTVKRAPRPECAMPNANGRSNATRGAPMPAVPQGRSKKRHVATVACGDEPVRIAVSGPNGPSATARVNALRVRKMLRLAPETARFACGPAATHANGMTSRSALQVANAFLGSQKHGIAATAVAKAEHVPMHVFGAIGMHAKAMASAHRAKSRSEPAAKM